MAKGVKRSIYLYINGEEVENNIKSISSKMSKLINEQKKMTIGSDEYIAHAQKIKQLRNVIDEHNQSLKSSVSNWDKMKNSLSSFGNIITGATLGMQSINQVIGNLKKMATDLAEMDDVYADVIKYTGMTRDEVIALNEEFKKMNTRTSREELNRLAGEAGKLGIQSKEKILEFVDAADKINVALGEDLGEDAVKNIGKMAEMFGEVGKKGLKEAMLATGSAINTIGQTSSAAEPYLLEFTARLSGTANQAKITQAEVLGYASVLDQNMQQLEMSATAMQNLIMKMMQNPAKFAKMAGVEVGKFSDLLKNDANEAVLTLIETLSKKGGLSQLAPMFKEMGLDGVRASGVISVLANNVDKIREEQNKATKAYEEGSSVINEYNVKNNNMQAEMEKARKKFQDTRLELGEKLYPILIKLTKTSTGFIKLISSLSNFISENKGFVVALGVAWAAYVAIMVKAKAITLLKAAASKSLIAIQSLEKVAVLASSAAYNTLTGNATRAAAAQKMLKVAMASTPWGAILAAVSAIGIGIYKLATRQTEAEKNSKAFSAEMGKQGAEARYLFDQLRKTTKGSDDYKKSLKKLNDLYPNIIKSHLDEKGALIDIEAAYRDVITSIRDKVTIQMKERLLTDAIAKDIEIQTNAIGKLREKMSDKNIGTSEQNDFVEYLKKLIEEGGTFLTIYPKLQSKFGNVTRSLAGFFSNNMSKEINKMLDSSSELKEAMKQIERQFGNVATTVTTASNDSGTGIAGAGNGTGEGSFDAENSYEKKYKAYLERLSEFRRKHLFDKQSDFIREIANTKAAYDEMIAEAEKFKDNKTAVELDDEKQQAIEAIVIKRAQDLNKKINELTAKSTDNKLLDAVAVQAKKYNDVIDETDRLIHSLQELNAVESDPDITNTIDELLTRRKNLYQERSQEINDIIKKFTKEISDSLLPEHEKQIKAINDRYDREVEIIKASIEEKKKIGLKATDEEIKYLEDLLKKIEVARDKELSDNKLSIKGKLAKMLGFEEDDLDKIIEEASKFADTLANGIVRISANRNEKELNDYKKTQDSERDALQHKLDQGIISQDEYNERITELDKELADKELQIKKEQWKTEQAAAISQAIINAALSITSIWAKYGATPYIAGILTAISAAATAVEIATIASEPEPYETGGYINNEKIIKIGEKGKKEWVASNTLVRNPAIAPIIQALDDFQKGKPQSFNALQFATPSLSLPDYDNYFSKNASYSASPNYSNNANDDLLLREVIQMNKYMKDPKNRQAVISRKIQTKFDVNESQLKNISIL